MSAQGVASTLLEGMYHLVTQLYTHEAGGWPRGRFSLLGPRLGRRKPARLPQESKSFRTYFPTRLPWGETWVFVNEGAARPRNECWAESCAASLLYNCSVSPAVVVGVMPEGW